MASRALAVSIRDSPFWTELVEAVTLRVSAERRLAASSKEARVRVRQKTPVIVIGPGVNPLRQPNPMTIQEFQRLAAINPEQPVILSVGRLVKRKGFAWFAMSVLPRLPQGAVYIVIGEGKEMNSIQAAASAAGVRDRLQA